MALRDSSPGRQKVDLFTAQLATDALKNLSTCRPRTIEHEVNWRALALAIQQAHA